MVYGDGSTRVVVSSVDVAYVCIVFCVVAVSYVIKLGFGDFCV